MKAAGSGKRDMDSLPGVGSGARKGVRACLVTTSLSLYLSQLLKSSFVSTHTIHHNNGNLRLTIRDSTVSPYERIIARWDTW